MCIERTFAARLATCLNLLVGFANLRIRGRVIAASGAGVDLAGMSGLVNIGDRVRLSSCGGAPVLAEVVGFNRQGCRAIAYHNFGAWGLGSFVSSGLPAVRGQLSVHHTWLGRVIDPLGCPLDGRGPLAVGENARSIHQEPPPAASRASLGDRLDLGVAALNLFATCRHGQRLGMFAGSGVGKSTLMGMMAENTKCDVTIIAMIGERGREVREFIENKLSKSSQQKSIVVVATSDSSNFMKKEATLSALTISEYFRDMGCSVLLIVDSITRYCNALREIAMLAGETPLARGYPASVFSDLSNLVERAGPGVESDGRGGYVTAMFSVLVDGDDFNDPVADAIRGFLDGHVVLDRKIAERGLYPAINILKSLSRSVPECNSTIENSITMSARKFILLHEEMYDMIRLGLYRPGSNNLVDKAIKIVPKIEQMLMQDINCNKNIHEHFSDLYNIIEEIDSPQKSIKSE